LILKLDGEKHKLWTCRAPSKSNGRDYDPLRDIDGVEKKTVYSSGRRQPRGETQYKNRYKFKRELVENHDNVVLIKRKLKTGGNANGVDYSNKDEVGRWKLVTDG